MLQRVLLLLPLVGCTGGGGGGGVTDSFFTWDGRMFTDDGRELVLHGINVRANGVFDVDLDATPQENFWKPRTSPT